jgi:hypothetical protein
MTAKPTDGVLACLAAVRAAYLDLGIIKRALAMTLPSRKKAKVNSMALTSAAVYSHRCAPDGDWTFSRRAANRSRGRFSSVARGRRLGRWQVKSGIDIPE